MCLRKAKEQKTVHLLQVGTVSSLTSGHIPEIFTELSVSYNNATALLRSMVDMGADISTMQLNTFRHHFPHCPIQPVSATIRNFDGSVINSLHGKIKATVSHGGRQTNTDIYITSNNLPSIAGRDLICAFALQIDGESLNVKTCVTANSLTNAPDNETKAGSAPTHEHSAFSNYPSLLDNSLGTYPGYKHVIALSKDFQPHATKVQPVPLSLQDTVMTKIQNMVSSGIWSPVEKSKCVHAMVTIGKKDGGVRITSNPSLLNKYIIPDHHLLPLMEELFLKLHGMSHFSKIDLRKGYYHIELDNESKHYTATIMPLGLMAYNHLPMGLKDAASVF